MCSAVPSTNCDRKDIRLCSAYRTYTLTLIWTWPLPVKIPGSSEFYVFWQVCRSSLLPDRNVRWPRRMLPPGDSRWVCRPDRQTDVWTPDCYITLSDRQGQCTNNLRSSIVSNQIKFLSTRCTEKCARQQYHVLSPHDDRFSNFFSRQTPQQIFNGVIV